MNGKKANYTLIEILVVLMLIGILSAIGIGALNGISGSGGISGTVRALSSQMSLARSEAVARNRFVGVLLPDATVVSEGILNNKTVGFDSPDDLARLFVQSRLCYVALDGSDYVFVRWVDDSSWVKWSKGIIVCASENYSKVINVDNVSGKSSAAVVFANSGALTHSNIVKVQVFRARYNPEKTQLIYPGNQNKASSWEVTINPFTGRTAYEKKHK